MYVHVRVPKIFCEPKTALISIRKIKAGNYPRLKKISNHLITETKGFIFQ